MKEVEDKEEFEAEEEKGEKREALQALLGKETKYAVKTDDVDRLE